MGRARVVIAGIVGCLAAAGCGGSSSGASEEGLLALAIEGRPSAALPLLASTSGGEHLVAEGMAVAAGTTVHFGSLPAEEVRIEGGSRLRARTPAAAAGLYDLRIVAPGSRETLLPGAVRFVDAPLLSRAVVIGGPTDGQPRPLAQGGSLVEVSGHGFQERMSLHVGGNAVSAEILEETRLRFIAPRHAEGVAELRLDPAEGPAATLPGGLAYTKQFSLAPESRPLDASGARHLHRRAAFGAPPARIERAVSLGLAAAVEELLHPAPDPATEARALAHYSKLPPLSPVSWSDNQNWWLTLLAESKDGLQERPAFLLHGHFATSQSRFNTEQLHFMHEHVQKLRAMARGNWRDLAATLCVDKAMLLWLDGLVSTRRQPNENFARELWELFLLGEGHGYTEAGIKEASRGFTGFRMRRMPGEAYDVVDYVPELHDAEFKTIFGVRGRYGYDALAAIEPCDAEGGIVDLTLRERPREAARHLARRLAAWFLYDDPHELIVEAIADEVIEARWELLPVLRTIFLSEAMFSSATRRSRVAGPMQFAVGLLRSTGRRMHPRELRAALGAMGQAPMEPPSVAGWPGGVAWLDPQSMVERINSVRSFVAGIEDARTDVAPLVPAPARASPAALVDHLAQLLDLRLSPLERDELVAYAGTAAGGRVGARLPPFEAEPELLRAKTRGLLWILAQHPDAHRN